VPVDNLLVVDGVDPQAAALIEPYAISAHAVRRAAMPRVSRCWWSAPGRLAWGGGDCQSRRRAGGGGGYQPGAARTCYRPAGLPVIDPSADDFDACCARSLAVRWRKK
jgi:hypothetical protein